MKENGISFHLQRSLFILFNYFIGDILNKDFKFLLYPNFTQLLSEIINSVISQFSLLIDPMWIQNWHLLLQKNDNDCILICSLCPLLSTVPILIKSSDVYVSTCTSHHKVQCDTIDELKHLISTRVFFYYVLVIKCTVWRLAFHCRFSAMSIQDTNSSL